MFRKNVAGQNIPFLLVKASDGSALTGATVTVKRSIDGAAQVAATGSVTELAGGQYNFAPSQADMNGNQVGFLITASTAIPVHVAISTVAFDPTDTVRAGLSVLPAAGTLAVKPAVTLAAADVSGNVAVDLQTIKGQAVTCTAGVTVPTSIASSSAVAGIPTNPLLANDARLNNLDAAVSTRSTLAAGAAMTLTAAYDLAKTAAQPGDAMALTSGERSTLAGVIEGHLLNDSDGQALLQAIVDKVNATDVNLAGLSVSAIASASAAAILATPANKLVTDATGRVTVGANADKSGYSLTAAYNPAQTAAQAADLATVQSVSASMLGLLQDAGVGLARLDTELDLVATILGSSPQGGVTIDLDALISGVLDAPAADHNQDGTIGGKINQESSPVIVPLVTGQRGEIKLVGHTMVTIKRGDSYRLPFSLGRDCSGWSAWFGAKKSVQQTEYDLPLRQAFFIDQVRGTGYVELTTEDTQSAGVFLGELELRNGAERNTPEEYSITIRPDIVR